MSLLCVSRVIFDCLVLLRSVFAVTLSHVLSSHLLRRLDFIYATQLSQGSLLILKIESFLRSRHTAPIDVKGGVQLVHCVRSRALMSSGKGFHRPSRANICTLRDSHQACKPSSGPPRFQLQIFLLFRSFETVIIPMLNLKGRGSCPRDMNKRSPPHILPLAPISHCSIASYFQCRLLSWPNVIHLGSRARLG
jgi:hypothetical protein